MGYLEIGFTIAKVIWFVGTLVMLVKPLLSRVLPRIGLPFEEYGDTDTAYQELCYGAFHDDDATPPAKAGMWLLFVLLTQLALLIGGLLLCILWPLGVLFLLVWLAFSKKSKTKED